MTEKLANGGEVFAEVRIGDTHWVAAEWNGKFVTWKVDEGLNAYYGHYLDSKKDALRDLLKRARMRTY